MADAHKTSVAGSLATTFSEKLKVTSAKLGGDLKELNVAIIKATTSQFHVVPKEKHVRTLKLAVHPSQQRRGVVHILAELHKRLRDSTDWLTVLKTLITLHRLMRETEPAFMEELAKFSEALAHTHVAGGAAGPASLSAPPRLFCTDNFIDRTTSEGRFDFSEWVRAYGKYLEEQLEVFTTLKWYVEMEAPGAESRMRRLPPQELLSQLPHLQRLQRRLLDCVPRGAAVHDPVVLFALSLVVKESFKLYKAVSEGVINLADAFFEMEYHDAARGLEYYRESIAAADALSAYYSTVEQIDEIKRSMQLPKLSSPPADFLTSMEAYVAEAPRHMGAATDAAAPPRRGVPLRKGKLLQAPSAKHAGSGVSAAAAAAAAAAVPRDPGMVLPLPSTSSAPTASQSAESGGRGDEAASASSPTSGPAPTPAQQDLLGGAQPAPVPKPSPLDLLSGLDFSFPAVGGDAAAGPATASAPLSSNPFADPMPAQVEAPAMQPPTAAGSSNPFGDPTPSPAGGASGAGFAGTGGFEWPMASPAAAAPQLPRQPVWGEQQQQQPLGGYAGYAAPLPSPAGAAAPQLTAASDDPFANFGAPSPASAPRPSSGAGAFWTASPAPAAAGPYGAVPSPPRAIGGDELSKAALHDPFAALTGLPPKSSPGAAGSRPSPPRAGVYPPPPPGFF